MHIDLQTAIIAAGAALVGAAIPTLIGYFTTRKISIREKQKEVYYDFWEKYQIFKNSDDKELNINFNPLLLVFNKVFLYGDKNTTKAVKLFFDDMLNAMHGKRRPLSDDEYSKHEKEIMNKMRKNLGLGVFDSFSIIRFTGGK